MPYLRLQASVNQIKRTIRGLCAAYVDATGSGSTFFYQISVILMYLFCVLEDVVAFHKKGVLRELVDSESKEDGVLVRSNTFFRYAKEVGIIPTQDLSDALYSIINIRNRLAHDYRFANQELRNITEHLSATDSIRIFKYALSSINLDPYTRLLANKLLSRLYSSNSVHIDALFQYLFDAENKMLLKEIDECGGIAVFLGKNEKVIEL